MWLPGRDRDLRDVLRRRDRRRRVGRRCPVRLRLWRRLRLRLRPRCAGPRLHRRAEAHRGACRGGNERRGRRGGRGGSEAALLREAGRRRCGRDGRRRLDLGLRHLTAGPRAIPRAVRIEDDARRADGDLVPGAQNALGDALPVDEAAVERSEVAEHVASIDEVDVAVLFRHDPIEDLHRVVGMPAERVVRQEVGFPPSFGGDDGDPRHGWVRVPSAMLIHCSKPSKAPTSSRLPGEVGA